VGEAIEPSALHIPGRHREHEGEVARNAGLQEPLLECEGERLRKATPCEPADDHTVARADQPDRLRCVDGLVACRLRRSLRAHGSSSSGWASASAIAA
jgi:hypothetical protein